MNKEPETFAGAFSLPKGNFKGELTEGCLILQGGAFRGVYTNGVIDRLLMAGIKLSTVVGVSAGALNGMIYAAGNIGLAGRCNLIYRHDPRYFGLHRLKEDQGIMGFKFMFGEIFKKYGFDYETFYEKDHSFYAAVTNCLTGEMEYVEKSDENIFAAVKASASMPLVSKMVDVNGTPCLDGCCSVRIPLDFGLERGFKKILVVCTRPRGYRRKEEDLTLSLERRVYKNYPNLVRAMENSSRIHNETCDRLDELEKNGEIIVIAPSKDLNVKKTESDMDKLGRLYYLGYNDTEKALSKLKHYLR